MLQGLSLLHPGQPRLSQPALISRGAPALRASWQPSLASLQQSLSLLCGVSGQAGSGAEREAQDPRFSVGEGSGDGGTGAAPGCPEAALRSGGGP